MWIPCYRAKVQYFTVDFIENNTIGRVGKFKKNSTNKSKTKISNTKTTFAANSREMDVKCFGPKNDKVKWMFDLHKPEKKFSVNVTSTRVLPFFFGPSTFDVNDEKKKCFNM